jgi:two-component system response regulator NreC
MVKLVIVDDHKSFRESLAIAVSQAGAFEIVGQAGTAREACVLLETQHPDLVVLDLMLEASDGIALTHELKRRRARVPILVLTMHASGLFVREALDAGVQGYALKEQPLSEIIEAMRICARGERYVSPLVGAVPPARNGVAAEPAERTDLVARLSRREREVFSHVIRGSSSQAIANSLCISLKTVETHRAHINRKLGIHSSAELIRLAALKGLLPGQNAKPDGVTTTALS